VSATLAKRIRGLSSSGTRRMNGHERTQVILPTPQQLFTPGVTAILIILLAGYLVGALAGAWALDVLALSPPKVLHGMLWQLVTYWMVQVSPLALVLQGLIVLTFGSAIERQWRSSSFLVLWLVTCVVCGLIWVMVYLIGGAPYTGWGASSGCFGLIGAFGLLFRGQRLFFFLTTIEARVLALILIGIGVVLSLYPQPIGLVWVLGALVSFVYIKLLWLGRSRTTGPGPSGSSYRPNRFVDVD